MLGRDFSGIVEQAGEAVSGISEGDEVFGFIPGMSPKVHDGTWAELIAVPESVAIRKPRGVDTTSGGVGSFAVQMAADAGATVIASALPEDEGYLRGIGVSEILPREADVAALVRERYPEGIEALLDLVSYAPDGFDTHAEGLTNDGRGASPLSAAGEGSARHNIMAMPTREHLRRLARQLEEGTLKVNIQQTYELDQASEALQALATEHTQGKRAIRVALADGAPVICQTGSTTTSSGSGL